MVETVGRVRAQVEDRDAPAGKYLAVDGVAFAEKLAQPQHQAADNHADHHPAGWANPIVIEGVLKEKADAQQQRQHADLCRPRTQQLPAGTAEAPADFRRHLRAARSRGLDALQAQLRAAPAVPMFFSNPTARRKTAVKSRSKYHP